MEFISHPWVNKNSIEKRSYQENLVQAALKGNTLCVLPTGLGKTSIAAMVAAERLKHNMNGKILFMAPTKPLVDQHRTSFARMLKIGESELKIVTGEDKPEQRSELYKKADVILATPQTIENDLKQGTLSLKNFSLCIFDEAHRCIGNYAYTYIAKVYINQCTDPLILALTASPGSELNKITMIKDNLFVKNVAIKTRDDPDVKPYVQEVKHEWIEVDLPIAMNSIKKYLDEMKNLRIKKLIGWKIIYQNVVSKSYLLKLQEELIRRKTGMSFAALRLVTEIIKIDHALLLLETQCLSSLNEFLMKIEEEAKAGKTKASQALVKEENWKASVRLTNELIKEGQEHPKLEKLKETVSSMLESNKYSRIIIFAQYRDTIAKIASSMKKIKNAAPVEFIGQAKKKGKGLSQKEQVQILNEFKMGFYNILCASQVAEEGLDIVETDAVIFYEPTPSAVRKIQRAGRTARTQVGRVIILLTKGTRDEAYHWASTRKEQRMKNTLYAMQRSNDINKFKDVRR
ncbi:MAG: DEAD/DEAH box helicase [Candidatus Aenigmarchaeota archaeon]|nr:DEAD/DEAH box helicase [Candidatus Aenigmarchaeota archaeon]